MNKILAIIGLLGLSLTACSSGGGSSNSPILSNNGYFRVVNGSADVGSVDVYIDGSKVNGSALAYGGITAYNKFAPGTHTLVIDASGTQTAIAGFPAASLSQGVNGGSYVSLVITGEMHPLTASNTLNLLSFPGGIYSTPSGGAAVDFYNAAGGYASQPVQFGYYSPNNAVASATIGTPLGTGSTTTPQGMPPTALNANTQIGFYATSSSSITITPSQFSTSCAANTLPCDAGNFSLYLIDGPADSTTPSAGPYPNNITASSTAGFVGIVDANGT